MKIKKNVLRYVTYSWTLRKKDVDEKCGAAAANRKNCRFTEQEEGLSVRVSSYDRNVLLGELFTKYALIIKAALFFNHNVNCQRKYY